MSSYRGFLTRVGTSGNAQTGDRKTPAPSQCSVPWTPERKELGKQLWLDGWSASAIADRLGGVTRNAVIGMVARLRDAGAQKLRRTSNVVTLGGTKQQRTKR